HPYPALSQLAQAYDADLNKYASLKAVAAKYNGEIYNKRRLMVELPTKGGLPLQPMGPLTPEPVATYVTEMPSISSVSTLPTERHIAGGSGGLKPNGQKPKGGHAAHSSYSSNTIAGHAAGFGIKGWDGTETVGRRKSYGHKRPQCTVLEPNQLHGSRGQSHSQHFLPTQPYFVTNSKTEVTV
uniref:Uncharacterized protein n=1 Tax=Poecilia formosa TaxID=48698 RepID=A0A096M500_POEFO